LIYSAKGELEEALKYHKKALEIDRQIGYVQGEANQLGNIGLIYREWFNNKVTFMLLLNMRVGAIFDCT
jgi:tetratricopeptide (TPR) repeat protein